MPSSYIAWYLWLYYSPDICSKSADDSLASWLPALAEPLTRLTRIYHTLLYLHLLRKHFHFVEIVLMAVNTFGKIWFLMPVFLPLGYSFAFFFNLSISLVRCPTYSGILLDKVNLQSQWIGNDRKKFVQMDHTVVVTGSMIWSKPLREDIICYCLFRQSLIFGPYKGFLLFCLLIPKPWYTRFLQDLSSKSYLPEYHSSSLTPEVSFPPFAAVAAIERVHLRYRCHLSVSLWLVTLHTVREVSGGGGY